MEGESEVDPVREARIRREGRFWLAVAAVVFGVLFVGGLSFVLWIGLSGGFE
jgi:hypothetical protein